MRVDRILGTIKDVLRALDNNITLQDNFGPSGAEAGEVIVSVGRKKKPVWSKLSDLVNSVPGLKGEKGDKGDDGASGTQVDCLSCIEPILSSIVCSGGEVVTSNGEVVWSNG